MQGAGTITLALVLIGGCSQDQPPPEGDPGLPDAAVTQDQADAAPQVTAQGTFCPGVSRRREVKVSHPP